MRNRGIIVDDQANGLAVPSLHHVPLGLVCRVLLLREEEQRFVVVSMESLLVQTPFEMACRVHMLINEDIDGFGGIGVGCHGIEGYAQG